MGQLYNWECTNADCGNDIKPVSGGDCRGFEIKTQTRICTNCKHLDDYKVGVVSDPSHRILLPTSMSINLILPPHVMYAVLKPSSGTEAAQSVTYK